MHLDRILRFSELCLRYGARIPGNTRERALIALGAAAVSFRASLVPIVQVRDAADLLRLAFGSDEASDFPAAARLWSIAAEGADVASTGEAQRRTLPPIETTFGTVSEFLDLVVELVWDEELNAFLWQIDTEGDSLSNSFHPEKRAILEDLLTSDNGFGRVLAGLFRFVDFSCDLQRFLIDIRTDPLADAALECLSPVYVKRLSRLQSVINMFQRGSVDVNVHYQGIQNEGEFKTAFENSKRYLRHQLEQASRTLEDAFTETAVFLEVVQEMALKSAAAESATAESVAETKAKTAEAKSVLSAFQRRTRAAARAAEDVAKTKAKTTEATQE